MKCIQCGTGEFDCRNIRYFPSVKQETVEVAIPAHICTKCGYSLLTNEQVNVLRRAAIDQYRENHNLLTSQSIIGFRKSFGMSQKAFTEYLDVRKDEVKGWETYSIQNASQDDYIRLKCDPLYAEENLFMIQQLNALPDIYNGMKKFSLNLFKHATLFFMKNAKSDNKFLPSLHFYADFLNFKRHQKSITGNRYLTVKSGPCPNQCFLIYKILQRGKSISLSGDSYQPEEEPDLSVFDDAEKNCLRYVCDFHNSKKQSLIKMSQHEKAFTDVKDYSYISYSHAVSLLI